MKNIRSPYFWLFCLLLACSCGFSATLSYPNIKSLYKEGEFEKIRVSLEGFLKQNANSAQTLDRIFAYKYLGVIYAAEPQGYPVAETYFYQLLKLAPNAHLSDLYVSSSVEDLFEKTRERFQKENRDNSEFDEFGSPRTHAAPDKGVSDNAAKKDSLAYQHARMNSDPVPDRLKPPKQEAKIRVWPWVVGGAAIAAVGGYWWYASQEKKDKVVPIVGPQN